MRRRIVVLVSGTGTLLQALLDACADRDGVAGLRRSREHGVPTFVRRVGDYPDRAEWDRALADEVSGYEPDLVVLAGFMKLTGPAFLARFGGRTVNTHPALLPSFPGMHGARDALAHGVKVSGCTVFVVDEDVDGGPIIDQATVPVLEADTEESLHERIKSVERAMLVEVVGRMVREGWTVDGRKVTIP